MSAHQGPGQRPWEENSSWQSPGLILDQNGMMAPGLAVLGPWVWGASVASSQGLDGALAPPSTPCVPLDRSLTHSEPRSPCLNSGEEDKLCADKRKALCKVLAHRWHWG